MLQHEYYIHVYDIIGTKKHGHHLPLFHTFLRYHKHLNEQLQIGPITGPDVLPRHWSQCTMTFPTPLNLDTKYHEYLSTTHSPRPSILVPHHRNYMWSKDFTVLLVCSGQQSWVVHIKLYKTQCLHLPNWESHLNPSIQCI